MKTMKTVYDNGGKCLGYEWIDLSGLQLDTTEAILQMIYLDETVNKLNSHELSPMEKCLLMGDSDAVNALNYGPGT